MRRRGPPGKAPRLPAPRRARTLAPMETRTAAGPPGEPQGEAPVEIERLLHELWIGAGGLRREDLKKAREIAALLRALPAGPGRTVVDAAAGHGYVGLLHAHRSKAARLVLIERDAARAARCQEAAARLSPPPPLELRVGEVGDAALWPEAPDLVVALHACGAASDAIIDRAIAARARWLFLVPCCYARAVPFSAAAEARAEALGLPRQAPIRRRFVESMVDGERALRLEAAGYEVTLAQLVPPSVTPHNLLLRARRCGEPVRQAEAAERLRRLREPPAGAGP